MKHLLLKSLLLFSQHLYNQPTPNQLGKTHFIVGQPKASYHQASKSTKTKQTASTNTSCRAYFSPQDNIKQQLLDLIIQEKKSIKVSVYTFTDKDIALALVDAKKRGIDVEVITDGNASKDKFSKIGLLIQEGVTVRVYEPHEEGLINNIMHHKFVVFGNNKDNVPLLWTGSYNFTKSANSKNQENVIVLHDQMIIDQYLAQFEQLKKLIAKPFSKYQMKQKVTQTRQKKNRSKANLIT